ncbi:MAG TPA: dihydropteroate synthase [Membranihabitans sp.]|nr:dihydropteroate synthase [Membranihabitans sp.]
MGIVNINSDSFYDVSRAKVTKEVMIKVESMIKNGAAIIDIGAMSSRPGSSIISPEEEWTRMAEILPVLRKNFQKHIISVDTVHSSTAQKSLDQGVDIINDISGGTFDRQMMAVVGQYQAPFVVMHMQGRPETMQSNPSYENVVTDVFDFFVRQIAEAQDHGIVDLILDPGFGFGKNLNHNYQLLQNLHAFEILRFPVLAGVSRKGMIQKILDVDVGNALNGTTAVHMLALMRGARILRAHDVAEATECLKVWEKFNHPDREVSEVGPYIIG